MLGGQTVERVVDWKQVWIDTCVSQYKTACSREQVAPSAEHFLDFYSLYPYATKTPFWVVWNRYRKHWMGA